MLFISTSLVWSEIGPPQRKWSSEWHQNAKSGLFERPQLGLPLWKHQFFSIIWKHSEPIFKIIQHNLAIFLLWWDISPQKCKFEKRQKSKNLQLAQNPPLWIFGQKYFGILLFSIVSLEYVKINKIKIFYYHHLPHSYRNWLLSFQFASI